MFDKMLVQLQFRKSCCSIKVNLVKILAIILIVSIGLISCSQASKEKEEQKQGLEAKQREGLKPGEVMISQKQFESTGIKLGNIEQRNLTDIVKANGFITLPPQNKASISAFIGGVVKSIFVQAGDYVKKGQTLALLEHPDYIQLQDDYLKAKNSFLLSEKEYYREKELFKKNLSSEQTYQQTESEYNSAKASFTALEEKVRLLNINFKNLDNGEIVSSIPVVSPINGYVQTVGVTIGKFADPLKEIFSLVDNSQLQLTLQVYEKDLYKMKTGQGLYFALPNQKEITGNATVFSIGKALDESTKSFIVLAKVTNNDRKDFLPGIYVSAFIETGTNKVSSLPNEAIVNEGQKNAVFVLLRTIDDTEGKEYIFGLRDVKVGISEAGFSEVTFLEEPQTNAKIVVKGAFFIESEMNKKAEGETD